jgi:hypothetical protein
LLKFSEQIDLISAALSKAQNELENADKNAANPHFRSKYADLAEILNTVRPTLSKHGLAVSQHPAFAEGMVHVTTLLSHTSGQWMQSCVSSPIGKADSQGVGSAITYLRRYSLAAVAGVAQEDDDGNAASAKPQTPFVPPVLLKPEIVKPLQEAKDLKSLAAVWGKIDVGIRHEYAAIKDARKSELSEVKPDA